MTAMPLPLSASADAPRDPDHARITAPVTLPAEVRAYVLAQPDALLVEWVQLSPQAVDVLTERERTHALALTTKHPHMSAAYRTGEAAAYVRERLVGGDHVQAAARIALEPGARVQIDRRYYTVTQRGDRQVHMTGERGGRLTLIRPQGELAGWLAWVGGVNRRHARLVELRRLDDSHFVTAAAAR